ncbi:site-specific integrase [Acidobacteria bacterium AH-259-G07]|nr:site-specific integrase [Acidobacteria bacterium AH-259-G07]
MKKEKRLGNNSVIHNMIIVAQFLKKQGRPGLMSEIDLPQKITSLPKEYSDGELRAFFAHCDSWERALFSTFLLTGFRAQEMMHLFWDDINFKLNTIQVKAKPELGFYPKHWEEREVPAHKRLMKLLKKHPHTEGVRFVFPSARKNRDVCMLDKCKALARRAELNPRNFTLHKFRSTYATRMLRAGFDPRTVQHWMGHKSLETTTRYLAPAKEVHAKLDQVEIAGVLAE